jgi:hypothetical protein
MFPDEEETRDMRLRRLRDDEQLLLGHEQRVKAPSSNKQFTRVVVLNSVIIGGGQLNLGTGRPKELLSDGRAEGVSGDTLDTHKHPEGERSSDCLG